MTLHTLSFEKWSGRLLWNRGWSGFSWHEKCSNEWRCRQYAVARTRQWGYATIKEISERREETEWKLKKMTELNSRALNSNGAWPSNKMTFWEDSTPSSCILAVVSKQFWQISLTELGTLQGRCPSSWKIQQRKERIKECLKWWLQIDQRCPNTQKETVKSCETFY